MLYVFLAVLYYCSASTVSGKSCDPSNFLCAGWCPPLPDDFQLKPEGVCFKDSQSVGCVCWLNNPSSQLDALLQCEAKINGSDSQVLCRTPSHCFPPSPKPGCLIVRLCPCALYAPDDPSSRVGRWRAVKAFVHAVQRSSQNGEGGPTETVEGDVREFSLKHLLFLLAFVIAPLMCWCLLNFFHDGKCRKKAAPQTAEAQPIPTARGCTIDSGGDAEEGRIRPTAPEAPDAVVVCAAATQPPRPSKCESPPPYLEPAGSATSPDCGPPPSYEDAVRGASVDVQRLWQTVFVENPSSAEES